MIVASVYCKRGVWYLRYKDTHGRVIARASAANDRREARRLAEGLESLGERLSLASEVAPEEARVRDVAELPAWWPALVWKQRPS